jgi:hypothetical protein
VTGLAWVSIVLSGLSTLGAAVYTVAFTLASGDAIRESRAAAVAGSRPLPADVRWMMDHVHLVLALMLVGSAAMLITSIGLLRRHEWARVAYVWLLGCSAVTGLAALLVRGNAEVATFGSGLHVATVTGLAAMMIVYGLIIAKLTTARVREEFDAAEDKG